MHIFLGRSFSVLSNQVSVIAFNRKYWAIWGFPFDSVVKNLPANPGDVDSTPGVRRFPEEENGNLLQYSCLGNPMNSGVWQASMPRVTDSSTTYWEHACTGPSIQGQRVLKNTGFWDFSVHQFKFPISWIEVPLYSKQDPDLGISDLPLWKGS